MEINKGKIIHTYNGSKWKIISNIILTLDRRDSNASIACPCKIPQPVSYLASHPDLPPTTLKLPPPPQPHRTLSLPLIKMIFNSIPVKETSNAAPDR